MEILPDDSVGCHWILDYKGKGFVGHKIKWKFSWG